MAMSSMERMDRAQDRREKRQKAEARKAMFRCRYSDCANGYRVASEREQVTCELCRASMGLPQLGVR
jgi:hypothetical protein